MLKKFLHKITMCWQNVGGVDNAKTNANQKTNRNFIKSPKDQFLLRSQILCSMEMHLLTNNKKVVLIKTG